MAIESKPKLTEWASELKVKVETMLQFKKVWMKFQMQTESYMKLDVALSEYVAQN